MRQTLHLDVKFPNRIISATSIVSICQEPRNFAGMPKSFRGRWSLRICLRVFPVDSPPSSLSKFSLRGQDERVYAVWGRIDSPNDGAHRLNNYGSFIYIVDI